MKRILLMGMVPLFVMIVVHEGRARADDTAHPEWMKELRSSIVRTLHVQANPSICREPDSIEQDAYFPFCLQGDGKLENIPDPFREMERLFLSQGWKPDDRYQADGHGSSSFAYTKQGHLCLVSVALDSSCDDEEEGHVPAEFWFSIYCREKAGAPEGVP